MIGQEYDELNQLVSDIRSRKQTIEQALEILMMKSKKHKQSEFGMPWTIWNIEINSSNGMKFGGRCRIDRDHIPIDLVVILLEGIISKAEKELIPLEKRFSSIKISMP